MIDPDEGYEPMEPDEMDEDGRHMIDTDVHDIIALEVDMIHRERRIAILSDGQEVPITAWFSAPNALPCDPAEAVSCVAGPDFDGRWYSVDLRQFTGRVQ